MLFFISAIFIVTKGKFVIRNYVWRLIMFRVGLVLLIALFYTQMANYFFDLTVINDSHL